MSVNDQPVYDVSGVVEKLGGDWDFIAECVDLFAAELPAMMQTLRDSVAAGSPERVHAAAHALKGMMSNFCEEGPARTAGTLDHHAREGRIDEAPRLLAELEDEVPRLVAALQALKQSS
jgi:HPt (histidine-containing phosphotransfer) domain-containing protein